MRVLLFFFLIAIFSSSHAQEAVKIITGQINDKYTFEAIGGVKVFAQDSSYSTYSTAGGKFKLKMPRHTSWINFQHPDYRTQRFRMAIPTRVVNTRMKPDTSHTVRYGIIKQRNTLAWLPLKFIYGAVGVHYQRFIKDRFSVGLYFDWFYEGKMYFGDEEYTGFKASPAFRYFFLHHRATGFYLQATAIIGYFDFTVLNYVYPDGGDSYTAFSVARTFWTGGGGAAIGGYLALGKSRRFIIDMNIGLQVFMANYPMKVDHPDYSTQFEHYPAWWYLGGPGSTIEAKVGFGMKF